MAGTGAANRALALVATLYVQPVALTNYHKWPIGFVIPVVAIGSLLYTFFALRKKNDLGAFLGSCGYIVGMLVGAAFALYPMVLPASTDPAYSLTIENTKTGAHGMAVGFVQWWSTSVSSLPSCISSSSTGYSAAR